MTDELNTNQSATAPTVNLFVFDEEEEKVGEEIPCLDSISPYLAEEISSLKSCILDRLRRQCSKSLMGPWADPNNVIIEQIGGGLSNYLYVGSLKKDFSIDSKVPKKVLVRVYGELLRSNMNSVVLDAVIFALLSEKRLGPKLYGVFSGGRIEEFVESRTLTTDELRLPSVRDCIAIHLGVLHSLTLPLPKLPTFLFKTMAKFLQQLTGTRELSRRLPTGKSRQSLQDRQSDVNNLPDDMLINPPQSLMASTLFGSTSSIGSIPEPQAHLFKLVSDWRLVEEFDWLRNTFFKNLDRFPVRFCHNDVQENNILLYKDPTRIDYCRLLCIDYEYCSYNFRGIDIGNFFNEWTYDNSYPYAPGFAYDPSAYPSRKRQLQFWRKYLAVYSHMQTTDIRPGIYIANRRAHSVSSCTPLSAESIRHLKTIPSAPEMKDSNSSSNAFLLESTNGVNASETNIHPDKNSTKLKPEVNLIFSELEEINDIEEIKLTEEDEEELIIETTYGALFSHVWWALWALIQSEICSIDFGFIEYAHSRMMAYYKMKNTLPASEFEDERGPTFQLPPFDDFTLYQKVHGKSNGFYVE